MAEKKTVTKFDLFKRILVFLGLVGFLLLCLKVTRSDPKVGWFGVALFGVMSILAGTEILKLRNHTIVRGAGSRKNIKESIIWSGTIAVSIFLGLLGNAIARLVVLRKPALAVWVAAFVATLVFYPFRGQQKEDFPTFPLWTVYCALMGLVSVGFYYFERLLR